MVAFVPEEEVLIEPTQLEHAADTGALGTDGSVESTKVTTGSSTI